MSKPSSPPPADATIGRRGLLPRLLAAVAGIAALRSQALAAEPAVPRVAYHLSDLEKVAFVLGNIENHIEGMGGPDRVKIVLVVHGPALNAFRRSAANPDIVRRLSRGAADGVEYDACGNTMRALELDTDDLLPGFIRVDQGGVTRLAQLQADGWAYLRP